MTTDNDQTVPPLEPKRDPRPQTEDGTYLCYDENCCEEADIATPRRIESTTIDPVETVVTYCFQCYLAWEVLRVTRTPLKTAVEIEEKIEEEYGDKGHMKERLYPRLLANLVLFDDPRGRDPPSEDSTLGDIFDHAGERGADLRDKLETPIEDQLKEFDILGGEQTDTENESEQSHALDEFM